MNDILTAVWSGSFMIFGVDLKCHTLSDGRRIIEADSLAALLAGSGGAEIHGDDGKAFVKWQCGEAAE